jgi:hypothetical protein
MGCSILKNLTNFDLCPSLTFLAVINLQSLNGPMMHIRPDYFTLPSFLHITSFGLDSIHYPICSSLSNGSLNNQQSCRAWSVFKRISKDITGY